MHILFVCSEFPIFDRPTGGFGAYVDRITSGLISKKQEISIICRGDKNTQFTDKLGRRIYIVKPVFKTITGKNIFSRITDFINFPLGFSWSVKNKIERILCLDSVNIIESGDFGSELFFYLLFRKNKYPKVVIKLHTPSFVIRETNDEKLNTFYRIMEFMESFCIKKADILNSPTKALAIIVEKRLKVIVNRIIPYPVIILKIYRKIKRNNNLVLYAGKIQPKKGIFILSEAIPKIINKHSKAIFIFVGPDTLWNGNSVKEMLISKLKKNHCLRSVKFLPYMQQKYLFKLYQKAVITVVPSIWENFPNVLLEAGMFGSTIVASKTGGIKEIIKQNISGVLFKNKSSSELAFQINRIFNNKKLIEKYAISLKKDIRNKYALLKISQKTLNFYNEV